MVGQRRVQFGLDLRKARGVEDEKADHPTRETGGNHKILEKLDLGPKQDAEEEKQRQESECDQMCIRDRLYYGYRNAFSRFLSGKSLFFSHDT